MVEHTVLDNGITVLTEALPESHSVSLGAWVRNGSRHETASACGISHFVEHMLFKGTARRSSHLIAKEVDSVGGVINGFTSRELSCYYVKVLAEKLPQALDLLGDLICHSRFDLDDIERERRVILQEIAMIEDNPEEQIHDLFAHAFWDGHALGRPVVGRRQTIGELSRGELLSFLGDRYVGQNLIIAAAGSLEHARVVDLVGDLFAHLPATGGTVVQEQPVIKRSISVEPRELEQVHICLGVEGVHQTHADRYALYLLNTILGGNMSSRLFQLIREEIGAAYSVYSYHHAHTDSGALVTYAATARENARTVIDAILHEMNQLCHVPVSSEELRAAKDYLKGSLLLSMESTDNRMTRLAKNELYLGREVSLEASQQLIEAVDLDQVQTLACRLFRDDTLNVQIVGPVRAADFPDIDLRLDAPARPGGGSPH